MKLKNVKVGTKVRVKSTMNSSVLAFYSDYHGTVGTIIAASTEDGDVRVEFSNGTTDIGHHSNLKRIKE